MPGAKVTKAVQMGEEELPILVRLAGSGHFGFLHFLLQVFFLLFQGLQQLLHLLPGELAFLLLLLLFLVLLVFLLLLLLLFLLFIERALQIFARQGIGRIQPECLFVGVYTFLQFLFIGKGNTFVVPGIGPYLFSLRNFHGIVESLFGFIQLLAAIERIAKVEGRGCISR